MFLRANGDLYEEADYRIKNFTSFSSDTIRERIYSTPHPVLLLNSSRAFVLYKEAARRSGDKVLPDDALKEYMKNADYNLGQIKSVRFNCISKGITETTVSGGVSVPKVRVFRAFDFDYNILVEKFGLALSSGGVEGQKPEEESDITPEHKNRIGVITFYFKK